MKKKSTIPSILSSDDDATVSFLHGARYADNPLWTTLASIDLRVQQIRTAKDSVDRSKALILLAPQLIAEEPLAVWREFFPQAIFLSENSTNISTDLILPHGFPVRQTVQIIALAKATLVARAQADKSQELLHATERNLGKLASVGIALSSENDLAILLRKILTEGQNISCCDAAFLFLIDNEGRQITFKLTQKDSLDFPFQESSFPLDAHSIAGNVVITKEPLNISNAYEISEEEPYKFNQSFDKTTGYKSISILTLPALNKKNRSLQCRNLSIRRKSEI